MHILMISDVYFPRINGVSTSIRSFRSCLKLLGHKVTLVVPDYPGQESNESEADVIRVPSRRLPVDEEDRMMIYREILQMEDQFRLMDIDIIHVQTPFVAHYAGLRLAKSLCVPCVESYHTYFEEYLYHYLKFLPKVLMRLIAREFSRRQCNSVNSLIVPSNPMAEALKKYGVNQFMEIIPTGINLEEFNGGDGKRFREKHAIDLNRPVMIFVGRVAHEKNIIFLIDMVREVKKEFENILLIIAGEGPAVAGLKRSVKTRGLNNNVMFIGYLDRQKELLDCYCAGDVFVFASRTETQGLVLLEAMALGVPVVSTSVMGTKDVLVNRKGALISSENRAEFAGKVVDIINMTSLRVELSESAKAYVQNWTEEKFAQKLVSHYLQVIECHSEGFLPGTVNI